MRRRAIHRASVAICSLILLAGCGSSGPEKPRPGTTAYHWAAANDTFRNGDYVKASDNLSKVATSKTDYATKARPWQMVLDSGIARGYTDLASNFETGSRANRAQTADFSRRVSYYRKLADSYTLQYVEAAHNLLSTNKDPEIVMVMPPPAGTAAEPQNLQKVAKGIFPPEAEQASLERAMMHRGVQINLAKMVGAGEDAPKAAQMFRQSTEVKVPREVFMRSLANELYDRAQLYTAKTLDQPKRLMVLFNEADEALKGIPQQTKQDKELAKKMQDYIKKYKLAS